MGQSITLKLGNKEYAMSARTPHMEHLMRTAAEEINTQIDKFAASYPTQTIEDRLSMAALWLGTSKVSSQEQLRDVKKEFDELNEELETYLAGIDK